MSTATIRKLLSDYLPFSGVPYGNAFREVYSIETNASGVATKTDLATAVVAGTKLRIGVLPAGLKLCDALAIVNDLFTASVTAKIGFEYVDGVDSTTVPQDDDYFFAALALSAVGRTRAANTGVRPVTLPKDAYLIVTTAAADVAAAGNLDVVVEGVVVGQP